MAENYEVRSIDELSRMSDMGGIEKYYRHRIKTKGGTMLTVDIDAGEFTAAKAGPILNRKAVEADKIKDL